MVTSNCVLTGIVGYHRSLELAMLELTLSPEKWKLTVPSMAAPHHPGPGEDYWTRLRSRFLQALDKRIRLVVGCGVAICIAS